MSRTGLCDREGSVRTYVSLMVEGLRRTIGGDQAFITPTANHNTSAPLRYVPLFPSRARYAAQVLCMFVYLFVSGPITVFIPPVFYDNNTNFLPLLRCQVQAHSLQDCEIYCESQKALMIQRALT